MVIQDTDGHVFGAYASERWEIKSQFFGKLILPKCSDGRASIALGDEGVCLIH